MSYNISVWKTFEYEYFYTQIDPSFNPEKLFYCSFCCLNFIKQTIYSFTLSALWWAPLLRHLVGCSWARIPKAVPWGEKFHPPSTLGQQKWAWMWQGMNFTLCVMIQKRKMEIYHVLIIFLYNSQFAERKRLFCNSFCSGQQSKHNVNIHVCIIILQKLKYIF